MQVALSYPGLRRWWAPIVLAIAVPLLFAALPGEPLQRLAHEAAQLKQARGELARLQAVQAGFQQMRVAGSEMPARTRAMSAIGRALGRMTDVAVLRDSIAAYDRALTHAADLPHGADTVGSVLGRLQANDEARLQEPWLAMRLAAVELRSGGDPRRADQLSHWAGIFAARLDGMTIPPGVRATLKARLAVYEHAVLAAPDESLRQPVDQDAPQAAARTVVKALANAEHGLISEQQRLNHAFADAGSRFVWSLIAAMVASLLIVGAGAFERLGRGHGVVRNWQLR